jgi:N-acetyl-gamma-glutamyl-phosphate reductase
MRRAAVLGAGGYVGSELLRLIATHPKLELAAAVSDSQAGQTLAEVHPELASWTDLEFVSNDDWSSDELRQGAWTVFASLGHGTSATRLSALLDETAGCELQLVDLSGDFRLDDVEQYRRYYGSDHPAPERLGDFVYGLPELHRDAIADAELVANPGCFATCAILSLIPAAAAGWPIQAVAITGMTGSSGAGATLRATTHHPRRAHNIEAYRPLDHQHLPEIVQSWRAAGGAADTPLSFVPHRTPLVRGIVVSAQLFLEHALAAEIVVEGYRAFYEAAPCVRVLSTPPAAVEVWGSNRCDLSVTVQDRMLAVSTAIDNLVKGAAGQAIQNANLMNGWDETAGLSTPMPSPV